ncbi:hypothetical protein [Anaerostipes sp.]|uniref:hypothetical protein n=1 Tax=Anaerostipes sp. TaxID=1872530 RepID=UPI002580013E|nr:hypothetical protein [Anaerostipes sp.]MBS6279118.1 hypothetical protein [Anaerostipes sp.]
MTKNSFKHVVELAENEDMQKRWKYFLKNIKDDTLKFSSVVIEIQTFLELIFNAITNQKEFQKIWYSKENKWSVIRENE